MEVATKQDLELWKAAILDEIRSMFKDFKPKAQKQWIKSREARTILNCSQGTLDTLKDRVKWTRLNNTIYWDYESIMKYFEESSVN